MLKKDIISIIKENFSKDFSIREIEEILKEIKSKNDIFEDIKTDKASLEDGKVRIRITIKYSQFYKVLSEMSNLEINSDGDIFKILKDYSKSKQEYDKIAMALEEVRIKGYGIVTPNMDELTLEEPEIVKQGNKFGVKLKASAPSIHIMCSKRK